MRASLLLFLAWLVIYTLEFFGLGPAAVVIDLAVLASLDLAVLASLSFHAERVAGELGVNTLYNVAVMSWVAALPQTVVAVVFAQAGKYHAAYVDSMASTLIDAMVVTALVRRQYIHVAKRYAPQLLLWTGAVLLLGATFETLSNTRIAWTWFFIGALGLPLLFAFPLRLAPVGHAQVAELLLNAISTGWIAYDMGVRLAQLHLYEAQLGLLGALFATAPDFLVALAIRTFLARAIGEVAGADDSLKTMFSAAVHDQISDPALVAIIAPHSVTAFPHGLNIFAALVKLTLLDPRLYWGVGLPSSIALLVAIALNLVSI